MMTSSSPSWKSKGSPSAGVIRSFIEGSGYHELWPRPDVLGDDFEELRRARKHPEAESRALGQPRPLRA